MPQQSTLSQIGILINQVRRLRLNPITIAATGDVTIHPANQVEVYLDTHGMCVDLGNKIEEFYGIELGFVPEYVYIATLAERIESLISVVSLGRPSLA
jgi:hypothetical protein